MEGGERIMITFSIITVILVLISLTCLRKTLGIIPIVIASAIVAGIVTIIADVTVYKVSGPDKAWTDTTVIVSDIPFKVDNGKIIGLKNIRLKDIDTVIVNNAVKYPILKKIEYHETKDMNLLWDIGFTKKVKNICFLNNKDYEKARKCNDS